MSYPVLVERLVDFMYEVRNKYPDTKVDCDGEISYANGNDGTSFDWGCNNRLCEFGWGVEDGSVWAFKFLVNKDGSVNAHCYPNGEMKPVEVVNRNLFTKSEAKNLYEIMLLSTDCQDVYDTTLNLIDWKV